MQRFDFDSLQSLKISTMPKAHRFFARIESFCKFREVVIDEKYTGVKTINADSNFDQYIAKIAPQ